jgi:hypothetical protein
MTRRGGSLLVSYGEHGEDVERTLEWVPVEELELNVSKLEENIDEGLTVKSGTVQIRVPQRCSASLGLIQSMSYCVGSRAAMFSGVLSAVRPVELIMRRVGHSEGSSEIIYIVPLDIYTFSKIVHPAPCLTSLVLGRPAERFGQEVLLVIVGIVCWVGLCAAPCPSRKGKKMDELVRIVHSASLDSRLGITGTGAGCGTSSSWGTLCGLYIPLTFALDTGASMSGSSWV